MGQVIQFPDETGYARRGRAADASAEPATVIILPVVRVERLVSDEPNSQEPNAGNSGRRRRRRAAR